MSPLNKPLVSIGIPTYNGIQLLPRTFSSLTNQSYENIEIIISDNDSIDGTEALVKEWEAYEPRIVYVKHPFNRGVYENYDACRQLAMGRYFMWMVPGEEIAHNRLTSYVSFLETHPDYVSVIGQRESWGMWAISRREEILSLEAEDPYERVQHFYAQVKEGGLLYGLHRNVWIRKTPMRLSLVGDWHFIAGMVFLGKMKVLAGEPTRDRRGESCKPTTLSMLVKIHGLAWWWRWLPSAKVGLETFRVISNSFPIYQNLTWPKRYNLAFRCASKVWAQQQKGPQGLLIGIKEPILAKFSNLFTRQKVKELRSKSL